LIWLGLASTYREQFAEGEALLQRALDLGRQASDDRLCSWALAFLGLNQHNQGRHDVARPLLEEAVRISRAIGNEWGSLSPMANLAEIALLQGERDLARELGRDGLALARRLGNRFDAAWLLQTHGELHRLDGAFEPALEAFRKALALARELDVKEAIQSTLDGIARVYAAQEKPREAARLQGAAEALRDRMPFPVPPAYVPRHEEGVAMVRARLGDERLAAEWARGRAMPLEEAIALAMGE
jgi:tetratricopeptide (TPR) repeat protein